jgi:type II secretory pathway component PulC
VVVVPAKQQKTADLGTSKLHQPPMPFITAPATAPPKSVKPFVASKPADMAKTSIATPPQISASVKAVPALRVNGIAFQDGGADSVAMINGVPVSSGSVIDGVKIEEIHKSKVIFSHNGERFEIPLGQSNR